MSKLLDLYNERKKTEQKNSYSNSASGESSSLLEKYKKAKAESTVTTSVRDHSHNPIRAYYEELNQSKDPRETAWKNFADYENAFLDYQKRIQDLEYLNDAEQQEYAQIVQNYLTSGGKLFTDENGFSEDAISKWQTQQAKIATGAAETADAYESFSSKEEFEHWKKLDTVEKRKEWYNTTTARLSEIDNQLDAGGLSKEEKKSLKKERADLESKIKLYETGQKDEQGFSYGYKVADDYSDLTLNADFGEKSKPTIDFSSEAEDAEFDPDIYAEPSTPLFQQDPLGYYLATGKGKVKGSAEIDARAKEGSWDELEQPEIDTYYYIMNTQGVEAATQYLYDMKVELNRRQTYANTAEWAQKYAEGNIAKKIGMNAFSVPANVYGAVPGFVENVGSWVRGESINPYTGGQKGMHYTSTVRGLTGSAIDEATGDKSFLGIKGSDVYQTLMSRADSALATSTLGGTAGSAVLGMSAAQNKAYDLYQKGADDNQILIASVAAGAAEMAWEKISYGKLKELGGGNFAANMAIQGYNEFIEEASTELTDIITDAVVMGRESEISELLEENNGDWGDVALNLLGRVWKSGVGGFLGGAGAAVTQTAQANVGAQIYNRRVGKDIKSADGGVAALQSMAQEKAEAIGEIDKRQSRRLMRQAGNISDNSSARKVGALYNSMLTASDTQNFAADQADIAKSLKRSGIEESLADEVAAALVAQYNGTASEAQNDLLDDMAESEEMHKAMRNIVLNDQSTMGQRRQDVRDFVASVKEGSFSTKTAQTAAQTAAKDATTAKANATNEIDVADGTFVKSSGENVQSLKISKIDGGKVTVTVNGKTDVSLDDVSWDRGSTALAYQAVTEASGMTPAAANMILSNPKASSSAFLRQALDTFEAGIQGTEIQESLDTDVISSDEALALYMEGLKTVKAKEDAIYNAYQRAKGILAKTGRKAHSGSFKIKDGVDVTKFDSWQAASAKLAAELSAALGVDIVLYQDSNPRRFGYYSESADAIFLNVNARWGESVNAKFGEGGASMMAFTLSHELVHRAKAGSPLKFRSFAQYLIREYNKAGVSVDALVAQQIVAAEKAGVPLSEDAAFEEVVCDACQRMLTDTDAGKKLAQWGSRSKSNSEFLQTVRDILTELLDNLRRLFKDVTNDSDAARAFRSLDKNVQQILADMFVDMSTDAAEKISTIKAAGMLDQLAKTRDISYNLAAAETHMEKLASSITSQSSVPLDVLQQRYSKILRMWEKIGIKLNSNFLNEWNSKVGTDRTFNVFKAQSGYKYNIELSTMCKKGVPLFEAIDTIVRNEIMKELDTDTLGKAEKEILYDILKSSGFEIPCAICYVEQARQREGVIIDAFLNGKDGKLGWNAVLDAIESGMRDNGVDFSFDSVSRNIATDNYTAADLNMDKATQDAFFSALMVEANKEITRYNKANKKGRALIESPTKDGIQKALKGNVPANLKVFKVLAMNPGSRFRIDGDLLYSSNTTRNLASAHHELYSLFNSQGGVSGYKTKQTPVVYWGDLLEKKWRPSDLRRGGGIRNQSNSDLQMYTLLDQVQMYIDLTAKGYYLQAYTKVVSELKLLGLSGAKINASLIPKVVVYFNTDGTVNFEKTSENAGLDEKGNPVFDDIEGIDHKEAFMLLEDPGYSKNVGGVCIGYSDNHIRKLLDDPRIQMVIGFHDKTNNPDKRYRGARYAKNYNGLNEARQLNSDGKYETVHVNFSAFLNQAEKMFRFDKSTETYEGTITYNGKEYNADDIPKLAADLYLEKYDTENAKPAYEEFKDHENYYKLLADFSLYDSQGHYSPHRKVAYNMPDTVPYLDANGSKQTMKTEDYIQAELEKEMSTRDSLALALADDSQDGIIPKFKAKIKESNTNPSIRYKVSADEDAAYMRAVNSWDKETEQKLVDQAAVDAGAILDEDGKPLKLYRGTLGGQTTFAKGDTYGGKIYTIDNINVATRYGDKSGEATEIRHQTEGEKTTYALYGFPKKMLTIDAKFGVWSDLAIPEELRKYADGRYKATNAEIADWAEQAGYDALRIDNVRDGSFDHGSEVIFFNENAVKSADPVTYDNDGNVIPLSERFNEGKNDLRYKLATEEDYAPTFYSKMQNVVDGIKQEKLGAASVVNMLRGKGVKLEEIKWSGIEEWLQGKKSVTKAELQEFIAGSMLQIEEEVSGDNVRWEEYKLNGGDNYREIVFRLPNSSYTNNAMIAHWGVDAEGVLAHARIQDFDVKGKKMLFIEEIQSDWHNEGHKSGYRKEGEKTDLILRRESKKAYEEFYTAVEKMLEVNANWEDDNAIYYAHPVAVAEMFEGNESHFDKFGFTEEQRETIRSMVAEEAARQEALKTAPKHDTAPDAPFKDNYHEYVLKRLLREAAENGYDSIGWTTAQTQVERWSEEFAEGYRIEYDQDIPKFLRKYGKKWGAKVEKVILPLGDRTLFSTDSGGTHNSYADAISDIVREANEFGLDVDVKNIRTVHDGDTTTVYNDLGIVLGTITKRIKGGTEVWSMSVTDSMKESVLHQGQELYKVAAEADLSDATILSRVSEENLTPGQKHNLQVYRERLAKVEEQKKAVEKVSDELSKVRQSNDPGKEAKIRSLRIQLQKEKNRLKIHTDKLDAVVNSAPIRELIAKEREAAEIRDKESIDRIISEMRGKYGTIPPGEKAVRDDSLPVSTKDDNKVSRSARTVKGAAVTTDEMAQMVDREVANGRLTYIPITNEDTAAMANSWVKKLGWESAKAEWYKDVNKGKAGADMAARGAVLLNNAAQAGDVDTWRELLFHFQKLSTNTAQGLQAMRILKQLEPTDKLYMIDRSVKQLIEDMNLKVDVEIDPDLQEEFLNAETDEQRDEIIDKIQKDVASQIPSTLIDKFNALRYLNMLGNLRTQVRNILGNFTMQTLNEVKNVIATGVQQIVYLASGKTYKKNRAIFASKKLMGQTYADYSNVKSLLLSGARYSTETAESSEFARKVNEYRRIFWKTPLDLLERYRKLTNWATDTGDLLFSKSAFVMAEARFLKARGIKDINDASPELLDEARAFAVAEAQEQTFRDTNWLSGWVTKIGRRADTPAIGKAFSEGVAPFRKTPANILVRAVEYSPAGIVVSSIKTAQKLLKDPNVTGDQLINSWAKSLTGTGLFVLGAWLGAVGILSGGASDDEDKDKFDKMYGQQNFALTIGEKNYTFDWMSPAAISILMGAQLNEIRQDGNVEWKDLESAITSLGEPMIEMSMLQGVKDVLDNVQYAKSNLGQMIVNVSLSYITQGLGNSLVGQIERSFEKNRETTYVDNDSAIPAWLQRTIGQYSNKVPGWDYNQIPYINAWGEEEETPNVAGNAWRNMVSPSYSDEFKKDAVYDELVRLNEVQDDKNVFPKTPSKTYTDPDDDDAVKRNLTAEEYVALAKAQGTTQRKLVEKMISNPTYKRMDDTDKAKAISFAYTYAKEKAQIDVLGRKDFSAKWMSAIGGGDPVYAILAHVNEY